MCLYIIMLSLKHLTSSSNESMLYILSNYKDHIRETKANTNTDFLNYLYTLLKDVPTLIQGIKSNYVVSTSTTLNEDDLRPSKFMTQETVNHIRLGVDYAYVCKLQYQKYVFNITFECATRINIDEILKFVKIVLCVCCRHLDKSSTEVFDIKIVLSDLLKKLPESETDTIGPNHVNSGYTEITESHKRVMIYREEEWIGGMFPRGFSPGGKAERCITDDKEQNVSSV